MGLYRTLRFITRHPMTCQAPWAAVGRFVTWQVRSRLREEVIHDWVGGARLAVRRGMTGATGNIYCGLHEYVDMSFVLHALRPGDLFVDIGANVGSYTVLAAAVAGAQVVAFEPDPDTFRALQRNVEINGLEGRVEVHPIALGAQAGTGWLTRGLDSMNHVVHQGGSTHQPVKIETLDTVLAGRVPTLIKMDVEGYEPQVLAGAQATLASAETLAVEIEDRSPSSRQQLSEAGLTEHFYDPRIGRLGPEPALEASNALFIKGVADFSARVSQADKRLQWSA